jgi:hyaluronan synthase
MGSIQKGHLFPHHLLSIGRTLHLSSEIYIKLAIMLVSLSVLILAYLQETRERMFDLLWTSPWGRVFAVEIMFWGYILVLWSFWRLWLALRYAPCPTVAEKDLPSITIVVPAFNEGPLIGRTLEHLARANYPADRLQMIVVDDGSDDDTWCHIRQAAKDIGPRLKTLRFKENRGKRWALWEGFRRAQGDVLVTLDSDSLIEPDALQALVSPIVRDPRIGGVAGNVRVLNRKDGMIPRLLAVRYVVAFDYKRAAQSMMDGGSVLCVAGALAAYRRETAVCHLDRWLHQTFLGKKARAGEDHAMTNFILKQGYKVVYQRRARVHTKVPTSFSGLAKMFLRWSRSNIRENFHLGSFIFTNFRVGPLYATRFNYVIYTLGLFVLFPFGLAFLAASAFWIDIFGVKLLAATVMSSLLPATFYTWREGDTDGAYGILYGALATFLLWWIWPFALLTCNKSVWLTRRPKVELDKRFVNPWSRWAGTRT